MADDGTKPESKESEALTEFLAAMKLRGPKVRNRKSKLEKFSDSIDAILKAGGGSVDVHEFVKSRGAETCSSSVYKYCVKRKATFEVKGK